MSPPDKVELRGMRPAELASEVRRYLAEASVAMRALQGNPLLAECEGRGSA